MEIKPYFEKIEDVIIEDIKASKAQLLIAVAWFTNHKIFNAIIDKLDGNDGFNAKLIVINDNINNRPGGLDFQKFVSAGGSFYFAEKNIPMHNKYMVIDSDIVITGSYNYTYYAETLNDENIVRIDGNKGIVQLYADNFNRLVEKKPEVTSVKEYLSVNNPAIDLFSYNNYALKDISLQSQFVRQAGVPVEPQPPISPQPQFVRQAGLPVETQKPIKIVEAVENSCGYENFAINNVIYEQWKDDYYIDRIEVKANKVKITFKTTLSNDSVLWSPNTPQSWVIRSSLDKQIIDECYAVRDICINNEMVISETQKNMIYIFHEEGKEIGKNNYNIPAQYIDFPKESILTCDVCFIVDNPVLVNGTIDFLEGKTSEKKENHWNAFNIQMNLNRERLA